MHAPAAALANGTLAHAFESDNLTKPGAGVHPGATLLPPGLAVAQQHGSSGRELITAVVAGLRGDVPDRLRHRNTVTSGAAFMPPAPPARSAPRLRRACCWGWMRRRMTNALGIAGSLAGGLMEFARSGTGAMVKRLHLGRASESGVVAASLAADGFTGPSSVLEGEAGFLKVFCTEWDVADLTRGLGCEYKTMNLCLKRFPVHMTAQTGVQAILELRQEHGFSGADVDRVTVAGDRADGDDQQHRQSDRHHDGAIFHSVLCRFGIVPRSARPGVVRRFGARRSGDPGDVRARVRSSRLNRQRGWQARASSPCC